MLFSILFLGEKGDSVGQLTGQNPFYHHILLYRTSHTGLTPKGGSYQAKPTG
jgi:hypothetical protein